MSGIWNGITGADLYEIHGSRVERWNDSSPSATVTLHVDPDYLDSSVTDMIYNRRPWPFNDESPYKLYCMEVEILPILSHYTADVAKGDEVLTTTNKRQIRVTYKPSIEFEFIVNTTVLTGTGTDYGYESQAVWVEQQRVIDTEFLTLDFNDFQWEGSEAQGLENGDPLKPEEAPGMIQRTIKFVNTYRNIFMTDDLEWLIYDGTGTVNDDALFASKGLWQFNRDQILFNIEDIKPTLQKPTTPTNLILYDLKCTFHCRMGESTWNRFYRPWAGEPGTADDSGWYDLYHHAAFEGQTNIKRFYPYKRSTLWYPLWVGYAA